MTRTLPSLLAIATVCSFGSAQGSAQGGAQAPQPIDSGTLTATSVTPMGTRTSTEEFTIVRNADGGFTMTNVSTGDRQMRTVLTTDSQGTPIAYEHHGKGGEASEKTITSRNDAGLVISESSTRNPPFAPYRVPANTLLFGDGGAAQVWFLGLGAVPRDVAYFEVGFWRAEKGRLSEVGPESVDIDGSPVAASHLVLTGGLLKRDFWLDSQKRLLKVSRGTTVAVRTKRPLWHAGF
jgi:hypothetical protein